MSIDLQLLCSVFVIGVDCLDLLLELEDLLDFLLPESGN
jgi:hypothetical protein